MLWFFIARFVIDMLAINSYYKCLIKTTWEAALYIGPDQSFLASLFRYISRDSPQAR